MSNCSVRKDIYRLNTCMRYIILKDDLDKNVIVDTCTDDIIGKVRNTKIALRLCQKLNRAVKEERLSAKIH